MAGGTRRSGIVEAGVTGLDELIAALKTVDPELVKEIKKANREAAKTLKTRAERRGRSLGSVAAKAAPQLGLSAGQASAGVKLDGDAVPYILGAEFGGRGRRTTMQFKPHRGQAGYFVFPTLREEFDQIVEPYQKAVDDVLKRAGLAVE